MKRSFIAALTGVSALAISVGSASAEYTLNILHINDLHSRIEPINRFDSTCSAEDDAAGECFGGVARVKTKIDERRGRLTETGQNVLVLDAGDQFQGSLFYSTYKGEAAAEFMNAIGFDAMAVGNHEFDDGPEGLSGFIDMVDVPVISGNTLAGANSVLADKIEPYVIKDIGGEKVGILSVLATDTVETSSPGDSILIIEEVGYLQDAVAELEEQGVNKIILLSHVGLPRDREIAAAVDGIDVIVGGHSHTLLSNIRDGAADVYPVRVANPSGVEVPIVQAYAYSKYLGEVRVTFDDDGNVIRAAGEPHLLDASVEPDADIVARVAELAEPIEELKNDVIGETTAMIEGSREVCRAQECAMGNLVADAMLDRVADQGIDVAIQNGGGLRASIDAGEVTMGEVLTVLPFQNTLATFQLAGADIVAALENGVSQIEDGAGRFPQVAGMSFSFDPEAEPGSRISNVMIGGEPLEPEATYGVVSNNYMRGGGDGYSMFDTKATNAYDFGPGLETVVADYMAENNPYEPYTDGRITMASAEAMDEGDEQAEGGDVQVQVPETGLAASDLSMSGPTIEAESTEMAVEGEAEMAETEGTEMAAEGEAEMAAEEEATVEVPETGLAASDLSMSGPTIEVESTEMAAEGEAEMAETEGTEMAAEGEAEMAETESTEMAAEGEAEMAETEGTEMAAEGEAEMAETEGTEMAAEGEAEMAETEGTEMAAEGEAEMAETEGTEMAAEGEAEMAETDERTHVIVAGDTFWSLAVQYFDDGTQSARIAEANPDAEERGLQIGDEIVIPQ